MDFLQSKLRKWSAMQGKRTDKNRIKPHISDGPEKPKPKPKKQLRSGYRIPVTKKQKQNLAENLDGFCVAKYFGNVQGFCDQAKVSRSTVDRWLGKKDPGFSSISRKPITLIADFIGVSVDDLLDTKVDFQSVRDQT